MLAVNKTSEQKGEEKREGTDLCAQLRVRVTSIHCRYIIQSIRKSSFCVAYHRKETNAEWYTTTGGLHVLTSSPSTEHHDRHSKKKKKKSDHTSAIAGIREIKIQTILSSYELTHCQHQPVRPPAVQYFLILNKPNSSGATRSNKRTRYPSSCASHPFIISNATFQDFYLKKVYLLQLFNYAHLLHIGTQVPTMMRKNSF